MGIIFTYKKNQYRISEMNLDGLDDFIIEKKLISGDISKLPKGESVRIKIIKKDRLPNLGDGESYTLCDVRIKII